MEISGIISAILIGIVLGFGGKLLAPGRQKIKWWLTILVGIAAAFVGTFLASALGVAATPGIDWLELVIQFVLAAIGVSVVAGATGRKH